METTLNVILRFAEKHYAWKHIYIAENLYDRLIDGEFNRLEKPENCPKKSACLGGWIFVCVKEFPIDHVYLFCTSMHFDRTVHWQDLKKMMKMLSGGRHVIPVHTDPSKLLLADGIDENKDRIIWRELCL